MRDGKQKEGTERDFKLNEAKSLNRKRNDERIER